MGNSRWEMLVNTPIRRWIRQLFLAQVRAVHQCDEDGAFLSDHGHDSRVQSRFYDQRLWTRKSSQTEEAHDHHGQHEWSGFSTSHPAMIEKEKKMLIRSWTMRMEAKSSAGSRAGWATSFVQADCICKTLKHLPFCLSAIYQLSQTHFFAQVRRVAAGAGVLEKEVQELLKQYAKFAQVTFVQAGL